MEISLENLYVDIGALRVNSKMSDNKVPKNVKTHHAIKSLFEINKEFSLFF